MPVIKAPPPTPPPPSSFAVEEMKLWSLLSGKRFLRCLSWDGCWQPLISVTMEISPPPSVSQLSSPKLLPLCFVPVSPRRLRPRFLDAFGILQQNNTEFFLLCQWFYSVVVITPALQTEGPGVEPCECVFFNGFWSLLWSQINLLDIWANCWSAVEQGTLQTHPRRITSALCVFLCFMPFSLPLLWGSEPQFL